MWAKSGFLFAARVVFSGETPESDSAICFDTSDLRRLLHYRLEVLEAALLQLEGLRAAQPTHEEGSMGLLSTNLLIDTLRGIVEEIEKVDPANPALVQLKYTLEQKAAELTGETDAGHLGSRLHGNA